MLHVRSYDVRRRFDKTIVSCKCQINNMLCLLHYCRGLCDLLVTCFCHLPAKNSIDSTHNDRLIIVYTIVENSSDCGHTNLANAMSQFN